ncbi:MAG: hypothetical protein A3K19_08600 [Lentisphaerae bacterium RIFOXYB12_FULL_65_16]|nr:MAG: hypothetical protein A3K18_05665 [Lentisphaerae bacterium RIFOXYA12_64_32]OGV89475.1 MAG: hypothetical protein A3K19_08600 [Lentisphaerae bacterium RIFOXYB12_FULL_65_16]
MTHPRHKPCSLAPAARNAGLALAALLLLTVLCGCQGRYRFDYGKTNGRSVNGVKVFFDLLRTRGHTVNRCFSLDAQVLKDADVAVLIQKAPGMPPMLEEWLACWLTSSEDRTLVFVARDLDASILFWNDVCRQLKEAHEWELLVFAENTRLEIEAQIDEARAAGAFWGGLFPFADTQEHVPPPARLPVGPADPLATDVQPGTSLLLRTHPVPRSDTDTALLHVGDRPFAIETKFGPAKVLILANATFLLNYSLIDHENRIMAANLADRLGPNRRICFLEAEDLCSALQRGRERRDLWTLKLYNPFAFLQQGPILIVVLHWLAVGLIFLACRAPIFGRPRGGAEAPRHRFASHIEAYGRLLERTGDREYAQELITEYRNRHKTKERPVQ